MQGDSSSGDKEHEIGVFSGAHRGLVMNVWGAFVSLLFVSALRAEWCFLADLQYQFRGYAWEWGLSAAPSFLCLHCFFLSVSLGGANLQQYSCSSLRTTQVKKQHARNPVKGGIPGALLLPFGQHIIYSSF